EVIDYFYTAGSLELPNRGCKANLLKMPRKLLFSANNDLAVRILGGYSLLVLAK
ncbi:MAG: methylase, partial [Desulfobacteraceae bacterium A6]